MINSGIIAYNSCLFVLLSLIACGSSDSSAAKAINGPSAIPPMIHQESNLLASMNERDLKGFQWMNPPQSVSFKEASMHITASGKTDFFNPPEGSKITATAPFLYREIEGDFVATALVRPNFTDVWNACALMVYLDSLHWIKFAFENADATGKSIVSVVTKEVSDDANGVMLNEADTVWLKLIRKGAIYAMHWSSDGEKYYMARLSAMPDHAVVKVGMEAQCPSGKAAMHEFLYFSLEQKTVKDMRRGE